MVADETDFTLLSGFFDFGLTLQLYLQTLSTKISVSILRAITSVANTLTIPSRANLLPVKSRFYQNF